MKNLVFFIFFFCCFVQNSQSTEPDEILENKNLEKIARDIGKKLRCLVCQNEDIENSNADIAKDLRILVRKKLLQGESEDQIISYIHSRYGDYVLFSPPIRLDTIALWLIPLIFILTMFLLFFGRKFK